MARERLATAPALRLALATLLLTGCIDFKKDLEDLQYNPKCPDCNTPLHNMGRYFRAPRRRNADQWRKVEMLYRAGIRFAGTQSTRRGCFPKSIAAAKEFIQHNRSALRRQSEEREFWKAQALREQETEEKRLQNARLMARKRRKKARPSPT